MNSRIGKVKFTGIVIITLLFIDVILAFYSPIPFHISLNEVLIGLIAGVLVWVINILIYQFLKYLGVKKLTHPNINEISLRAEKSENKIYSTFWMLIILLLSVILEEYLFRAHLLYSLIKIMPEYLAVIINIVIFTVIHFNNKILQLLFMGLVFCIITIYTNSIAPAIIAHALNNLLCRYKIIGSLFSR